MADGRATIRCTAAACDLAGPIGTLRFVSRRPAPRHSAAADPSRKPNIYSTRKQATPKPVPSPAPPAGANVTRKPSIYDCKGKSKPKPKPPASPAKPAIGADPTCKPSVYSTKKPSSKKLATPGARAAPSPARAAAPTPARRGTASGSSSQYLSVSVPTPPAPPLDGVSAGAAYPSASNQAWNRTRVEP
eukprot:3076786-Prymnesium_polylepis.2